MRLIDADALLEELKKTDRYFQAKFDIESAPTVDPEAEWKKALMILFNKYDVLLVHIDGKIVPVKNTSKEDCYNLLYEIQELINWRQLLFKKYLEKAESEADNG